MKKLCDESTEDYVIADFICPLKTGRIDFKPDIIIWMDTIKTCDSTNKTAAEGSTFLETDQMFEPPEYYDFRILTKDAKFWAKQFVLNLK